MRANSVDCPEILRLSEHTTELTRLRECDDDDRIDPAFDAVCGNALGVHADDFDDESLAARRTTTSSMTDVEAGGRLRARARLRPRRPRDRRHVPDGGVLRG